MIDKNGNIIDTISDIKVLGIEPSIIELEK